MERLSPLPYRQVASGPGREGPVPQGDDIEGSVTPVTPDFRDRVYLEDLLTAAEEVGVVVNEAGESYTRGDLVV